MPIELPTPVLSPCIGICQLDDAAFCVGCLRSSDEIGRWAVMQPEERRHIMDVVLPRRESAAS